MWFRQNSPYSDKLKLKAFIEKKGEKTPCKLKSKTLNIESHIRIAKNSQIQHHVYT